MIDEQKLIEAIIRRKRVHNLDLTTLQRLSTTMDIHSIPNRMDELDVVLQMIDELPKVDVTDTNVGNKWIPCSEELPKEDGMYNVTLDDGFVASAPIYSGMWALWADTGEVIAWQPLPEPYKEKTKC